MADVILYFDWNIFRPDQRQFRQQSIELSPAVTAIAVTIPLEHEFIHNSKEIIQAQLAGNKADLPILTMQGMKYVIDKFDLLFKEEEKKAEITNEDDWGDDLPPAKATKPTEPAKVEEEDWDNDTKKPDEVPWDESTEEWN